MGLKPSEEQKAERVGHEVGKMGRVHLCWALFVLGYALKWYLWRCLLGDTLGTGVNMAGALDFSPTPTHDNSSPRNLVLKIDLASMDAVFPGLREWPEWPPKVPPSQIT